MYYDTRTGLILSLSTLIYLSLSMNLKKILILLLFVIITYLTNLIHAHQARLFDKNINIKKRLFMTATRKITGRRVKKDGDFKLDINMDNPKLYGKVCYKLSFTKAAKKYKCIAKLKILVKGSEALK